MDISLVPYPSQPPRYKILLDYYYYFSDGLLRHRIYFSLHKHKLYGAKPKSGVCILRDTRTFS
jgi:hypothetical protein